MHREAGEGEEPVPTTEPPAGRPPRTAYPWRFDRPQGMIYDASGFAVARLHVSLDDERADLLAKAHLIAAAPELLAAARQAHLALVALGNALNWDSPVSQAYVDAINSLRRVQALAAGAEPDPRTYAQCAREGAKAEDAPNA